MHLHFIISLIKHNFIKPILYNRRYCKLYIIYFSFTIGNLIVFSFCSLKTQQINNSIEYEIITYIFMENCGHKVEFLVFCSECTKILPEILKLY